MTAFERKNGWVAKYVSDGKQIWVKGGPWSSKKMAQEAEYQDRERRRHQVSEITCAQFADRWLVEWERPATSTQRLYSAAAKRFGKDFGSQKLCEVDRFAARMWALDVPRRVASIIGTMYQDAYNVGLVESNPFANLRLGAAESRGSIDAPTMEEYHAILEATKTLGKYGEEFRAMVQFAAWTGIRQGELFALRWEDVREDEIIVSRSLKGDGTYGLPKNGKVRTVPLVSAAKVLDDIPRRPDDLVFHAMEGGRLTKGNHSWPWHKVRATSGVTLKRQAKEQSDLRWHDWRHFCATRLLDMEFSHFDVSVMLGHTDGGKLIMERYGHPSVAAARLRLLVGFDLDKLEIGSPATRAEVAS